MRVNIKTGIKRIYKVKKAKKLGRVGIEPTTY